jgi:nitronate monooxygenase
MFIISTPRLVIAQCKAGIVGSMPALNARADGLLDEWLAEITESLDSHNRANPDRPAAPFAINQIVHRSNVRLQRDMELCCKYKAPIIITSLGAQVEINDAAHSYGGIVLHDVINNSFAKKAIGKGADGLIAVAAGAGGHAGTTSPFALVQEIRAWFDGPLALSGAIATGDAILAAQAAGADLPISAPPLLRPKKRRHPQLQAGDRRSLVRGDHLYERLYRCSRQLSCLFRDRGWPRSASSRSRTRQDEFRR